jgi:hypothetical protein
MVEIMASNKVKRERVFETLNEMQLIVSPSYYLSIFDVGIHEADGGVYMIDLNRSNFVQWLQKNHNYKGIWEFHHTSKSIEFTGNTHDLMPLANQLEANGYRVTIKATNTDQGDDKYGTPTL